MRPKAERSSPPDHAIAGFTLLEMLVALALLALFASALPQAYGLIRRTWTLSAELSRDNPEQNVRSFLASRLAEATPVFDRKSEGDEIAFSGTDETLTFVAPLIHAPKGGGLYKFRLFIGADAAGRSALQVAVEPHGMPLPRDDQQAASTQPEVQRLAPAASVRIRYYGRPAAREKAQWLGAWSRNDALPDLVELTIVRENGTPMLPLVIEMRLRNGQ